jgi:hypothetical protein
VSIWEIFERLGVHVMLERVRLGRGVLGRIRDVFIAAMIVFGLGVLGLRSPALIMSALGLMAVLLLCYMGGALWYGHKHPAEAVLEDTDLVTAYRLREASKEAPMLPEAPLISHAVADIPPLTGDPEKPDRNG